jgi:hypothetical protein
MHDEHSAVLRRENRIAAPYIDNNNQGDPSMSKKTAIPSKYWQQGDVLLKRVDTLPAGLEQVVSKYKVLQQSETTGHHHHFLPTARVDVFQSPTIVTEAGTTTITTNRGKYIVVYEETALYHGKGFVPDPARDGSGDHKSLLLPPGMYQVDIVREYDYDRMEVTRVVD